MRTTRFLLIGALVVMSIALSGYESCIPIEPETGVCCMSQADCGAGAVCVGGGPGGYPGSCQPAPDAGQCYTDLDCPWGACVGGAACGCEENCPSLLGTCDTAPDELCHEDADCGADAHCSWITAGVCCVPNEDCDDDLMACLGVCTPHDCPTETELDCWCARPHCGDGLVAVIGDGCWTCVERRTCESAAPRPSWIGCE